MAKETVGDKISGILGVQPIPKTSPIMSAKTSAVVKVESPIEDAQNEIDFKEAIATTKRMVESGKKALDELFEIATSSQDPKTWDAYTNLMEKLGKINSQLVGLYREHAEVNNAKKLPSKERENLSSPSGNSQTNIYFGTALDLQRVIKNSQKDEYLDVEVGE